VSPGRPTKYCLESRNLVRVVCIDVLVLCRARSGEGAILCVVSGSDNEAYLAR
jgi:hypothetical protein